MTMVSCSLIPYSGRFQRYKYKGKNIGRKIYDNLETNRIYLASRDDGLYFVQET